MTCDVQSYNLHSTTSLFFSPKICDFEVAEELHGDAASDANKAGNCQWTHFGNVGGGGKCVDAKAVNRLDSVEVR